MKHLLILESHDPFESSDTEFVKAVVQQARRSYINATVFLGSKRNSAGTKKRKNQLS